MSAFAKHKTPKTGAKSCGCIVCAKCFGEGVVRIPKMERCDACADGDVTKKCFTHAYYDGWLAGWRDGNKKRIKQPVDSNPLAAAGDTGRSYQLHDV